MGNDEDIVKYDLIASVLSLPTEQQMELLKLTKFKDLSELHHYINRTIFRGHHEDLGRNSLQDYLEFRLHKQILLYLPPVIIVVGLIGNLMSLAVLSRPAMTRVSAYLYLSVLSVADTLILVIGLLRMWLAELTGYDIQDSSDPACKLISVLGSAVSDYSGWLIIAVTVERYVAVCHPLRAPVFCCRRRALAIVLSLIVFLVLVNGHFLWTTCIHYSSVNRTLEVDGIRNGLEQNCQASDGYEIFVDNVWPWVDTLLYSFVPFTTILSLNCLIIRKVLESRKFRRSLHADNPRSPNLNSNSGSVGSTVLSDRGAKLSVMLLTVSFAFLVMTLPMNITLIATAFRTSRKSVGYRTGSTLMLLRTITEMLMYANHSMNFFLYCATGLKFRQELCRFLCGWGREASAYRTIPVSSHFIALRPVVHDAERTAV